MTIDCTIGRRDVLRIMLASGAALSVPLMQGANGLPLGVQLVGPCDGDAPLPRAARWLAARVTAE